MKFGIWLGMLGAMALLAPGLAMAAEPPAAPAPIVFFDLAGPDSARLSAFYGGVFGWKIGPTGAIGRDSTGGLDGTLRQDPADKILYLGVPDVTAALKAVVAAGGAVIQPRFEVPGVVVIGLFTDPAGNHMGLVEMKDGTPVVPPARR
jgi:predicted enzyme related to lactoylglutathione lyase